MNFEYVKQHYGVPAELGRRVVVNGKPGVIAADRGHCLGVNFDCDRPGVIKNAHPTWHGNYDLRSSICELTAETFAQDSFQEVIGVALGLRRVAAADVAGGLAGLEGVPDHLLQRGDLDREALGGEERGLLFAPVTFTAVNSQIELRKS